MIQKKLRRLLKLSLELRTNQSAVIECCNRAGESREAGKGFACADEVKKLRPTSQRRYYIINNIIGNIQRTPKLQLMLQIMPV
jgi:hypothetical protein